MVESSKLRTRNRKKGRHYASHVSGTHTQSYIQWVTTVLSAVAAITASWFAAKMAIDYDAGKENGKTSLQIVEAFIDLQGCASRYVRNPKEWKFKFDSEKGPKRTPSEEREICSAGPLKKALVGSDGMLPAKQRSIVEKLCAELKEEIEQISASQLKSVLPPRDSLNNAKAIAEVFQTSQVIYTNAQFGYALFSETVRLSGYRCEGEKVATSEDYEEVENEYKRLAKYDIGSGKPHAGGGDKIFVGSPFGRRLDPLTGGTSLHSGTDFIAPVGTPIYAVVAGRVKSGYDPSYGNFVAISTNAREEVRYAHMASITAKNGVYVNVGDQVGTLGGTGRATGPHLHLEKRINDIPVDPSGYRLKDIFKSSGDRK